MRLHWQPRFPALADMQNIFFFDFDDTLYSHRTKGVSPMVKAALSRLHHNRDVLVIASGRGRESETFIRDALELEPDYLILMNGQLVLKGTDLIYENFAEADTMRAVLDQAESDGYAYGGYAAEGILVNHTNRRVEQVWFDFKAVPPMVVPSLQKVHRLYQGHLYMNKEEAAGYQQLLEAYIINWSHTYLVNLIPKSAGKSKAIRWLLDALSIARDHAYAFGDGFNDVDMLQAVGHGIAMGTGSEQLKAVAQYVTSPVDQRGVVDALEYFGLL